MNPLTEAEASAVWAVLVEHAGASDNMRDHFVAVFSGTQATYFYFQGSLGDGGRFRRDRERWYVDCHPEDGTPARLAVIEETNAALAALREGSKA